MKIVRMYDREERGGWQFAMVEVETKKRPWLWWRTDKRQRRVARESGSQYFRYIDTGKHTPGRDVENLWDQCVADLKVIEFRNLAQKAYLTA